MRVSPCQAIRGQGDRTTTPPTREGRGVRNVASIPPGFIGSRFRLRLARHAAVLLRPPSQVILHEFAIAVLTARGGRFELGVKQVNHANPLPEKLFSTISRRCTLAHQPVEPLRGLDFRAAPRWASAARQVKALDDEGEASAAPRYLRIDRVGRCHLIEEVNRCRMSCKPQVA